MAKRTFRIVEERKKELLKVEKEQKAEVEVNKKPMRVTETKKLSVSLPYGYWEDVDRARGGNSRSAYIRQLIMNDLHEKGLD